MNYIVNTPCGLIKGVKSKIAEWSLLTLGVVIGLYFNNLGIMGRLPIIANLQYTLAVFRFKDNQRIIKFSFLIHVPATPI